MFNKSKMNNLVDEILPVIKESNKTVSINFHFEKNDDEFITFTIHHKNDEIDHFNLYSFWSDRQNKEQINNMKKSLTI